MNINEAIEKISSGDSLKKEEIKKVFLSIMNNECNDAEIISFLMTLKTKGESVEEITGAAEVLREMCHKLNLPSDKLVDTCGTGGDGQNTFNVSTASAIVASASPLIFIVVYADEKSSMIMSAAPSVPISTP